MAVPDRLRADARRIPALVLALLLALVLVGCAESTDGTDAADASAAPKAMGGDVFGAGGYAPDPPLDWRDDTIELAGLPPEALETLELIATDRPLPYRQDGSTFHNREGLLPARAGGYYAEYTVETPGSPDRGARRLVVGDATEVYYTDDHYASFRYVVP